MWWSTRRRVAAEKRQRHTPTWTLHFSPAHPHLRVPSPQSTSHNAPPHTHPRTTAPHPNPSQYHPPPLRLPPNTPSICFTHRPHQPPPPHLPPQIHLRPRHRAPLSHNLLPNPARTHSHHPPHRPRCNIPLHALAPLVVRGRRMGTQRGRALRSVLQAQGVDSERGRGRGGG